MKSYSAVDVGMKRKINQDSIFSIDEPVGNLQNLYIVADGMGGHNAGDYASRYAVNSVTEYIRQSKETDPAVLFEKGIIGANSGLRKEASEHEELFGMGSTMVAATVAGDCLYVANVGDSRLYVEDNGLRQITRDHSLVGEMVRLGEITEEEARNHPDKNIITRALGASQSIQVDHFMVRLEKGMKVLICSDGLTNMVEDSVISEILRMDTDIASRVKMLIDTANNNGGKDNIAVIVVEPDA
ncbi:MAG: Stp1/IreP family PP2C-type Ser/Thr phosphatase [Lachnospiraceae bacterium]|jgi:serine/threonine protein phosphatase PrpC